MADEEENAMSKQTIGPREFELRRQREADAKAKPKPLADITAELPKPSGRKPVKRKRPHK
jgi:hypothetical protein